MSLMLRLVTAFVIAIHLACFPIITCMAQQLSQNTNIGEPTLQEHSPLITTPSGDAANNRPKPPAGTLVRPKDGVQHLDLDKAWNDYAAAVEKASQVIRDIIAKRLNYSTKEGNLESVEKWQAISDQFADGEALPNGDEIKKASYNPVIEYAKAKNMLEGAYAATVKALTKANRIVEAKKVREEIINVKRVADKGSAKIDSSVAQQERSPAKKVVFLSDLHEKDVVVGWGHFGKDGWLGYSELDGRVRVKNRLYDKALSMHGVSGGVAKVTYDVPDGYGRFEGVAAISDTVDGRQRTPLTLKIFGDDVLLWSSKPLFGGGTSQRCNVPLKGVKGITLVVDCPGDNGWSQAVWCDPHFVAD